MSRSCASAGSRYRFLDVEDLREESTGVALGHLRDVLRGALGDDGATADAADARVVPESPERPPGRDPS